MQCRILIWNSQKTGGNLFHGTIHTKGGWIGGLISGSPELPLSLVGVAEAMPHLPRDCLFLLGRYLILRLPAVGEGPCD